MERVLKSLSPERLANAACRAFGLRHRFADLRTIVLVVNDHCHFRCSMCDIGQKNGSGLDLLRGQQENSVMDLKVLKKVLSDPYVIRTKPDFSILMTEPLLYPEIRTMVRMIKARGYFVKISTNGWMLEAKADSLAKAGLDVVQVSLDGEEALHDSLRGQEGSYSRAIDGLRAISRGKGMKIVVNYTVSNLNYDRLNAFLDQLDAEGVRIDLCKVQFMYFVSNEMKEDQGKSSFLQQKIVTISDEVDPRKVDVDRLVQELDRIKGVYRNIKRVDIIPKIKGAADARRYFDVRGEPLKGNDHCYMPWNSMTINTDGKVQVHARCFDHGYGDVMRESVHDIYHGARIEHFRKELARSRFCLPACSRCCGVMTFGGRAGLFRGEDQ
jgi:MoaA/NifB/PqqE/SkfB family radical SAM enzyme